MPELPEVETMRRGILPVVGSTIQSVSRAKCRLQPISISPSMSTLQLKMVGQKIVAVDRLGKRVLLKLANLETLVIEPRMTGLVLLTDPPNQEHLRLIIELDHRKHPTILFWDRRGLGVVRLLSPKEMQSQLGSHKLGPDALELSAEAMPGRFEKCRQPIKVALLDQKRIAGIGNLYASELLHLAHVHPSTTVDRLKTPQWEAIHASMRQVLLQAIKFEGSTLADGTYRNALNESGSFQNHHRVYDRAKKPCLSCGKDSIVRIVQAQRSTFFCPTCQKAPRATRLRPTPKATSASKKISQRKNVRLRSRDR
jgi:formamidopyrimidine-DNA glycosylase